MKHEAFPKIDPQLIKILEQMYPTLEYDPELTPQEFLRKAAFRAGQIELIQKLKIVCNKQKGVN